MNILTGWKGLLRAAGAKGRKSDTRRRTRTLQPFAIEPLEQRQLLAIRVLDGFDDNVLAEGDELSSDAVPLGFNVNLFGDTYDTLFVNNNGSVSFGAALPNWSDMALANLGTSLIAPFYADIDTSGGRGSVQYGFDTIDGHTAFAVTWDAVGGAAITEALRTTFQLVIIDRSDLGPGNFDLEFNYDEILWNLSRAGIVPAPDAYARPGFAGSDLPGESYELIGSNLEGLLLDADPTFGLVHNRLNSNADGEYRFEFRAGTGLDDLGLAGQAIEVQPGYFVLGTGIHPDALAPRPTNIDAADTSNIDRIGPLGDLAQLTGAGLTVGLFEANEAGPESSYPLTTHQELTGRVTIADTATPVTSEHATHVAGTIAGAGVGTPGMATAVDIRAYNAANALARLAADAALLNVSNHSYDKPRGWETYDLNFANGVSVWLADRAVHDTEDPAFGKYGPLARDLDEVLFNNSQVLATDFLSIWAAGDQRDDQFQPTPNVDGYVAWFSAPPVAGVPLGVGYWLVPADGATAAPPADGNAGSGYDTLSDFQTAKNTLVVGSLRDVTDDPYPLLNLTDVSLSSAYGPTDDGRLGVHLLANGEGLTSASAASDTAYATASGTSSAAATATGAAVLLYEHYQNELGTTPRSATLKGLMIHNAYDIGPRGPDYASGYGVLDAAATAEFITKAATPVPGETSDIHEAIYAGVTQNYVVQANPYGTLKATLVWTDLPGDANPEPGVVDDTTRALVNDLDIRIIAPNGNIYYPWTLDPNNPSTIAVRTVRNEVDNVEQVVIDSPIAGNYIIEIGHSGALTGGAQRYSLLITAEPGIVDDQGPQITGVSITGRPDYDLFSSSGKTPGVQSLSIGISDLPARTGGFTEPATNGGNVLDVESNDTLAMARNIDRDFNLNPNPDIAQSTTIPHVTILGAGDDTYDYFEFTVTTPGVTGYFDIDHTSPGFDSALFLFDGAGNPLAPNAPFDNDNSQLTDGAAGSTTTTDSYFEYTFAAAGTYRIAVAASGATANVGGVSGLGVPAGASYQLHVSIPQHDVLLDASHFQVVGDNTGVAAVQQVMFVPDPNVPGQPATGTLQVIFVTPLPDDTYTLTVFDTLTDPAGNPLDGENNAVIPGVPVFPSGDGTPGGDFVARFRVDARPEFAVYGGTTVTVDMNGNGIYDPQNPDPNTRDQMFQFGGVHDQRFAGDLGASGYDVLALYGRVNNQFRFVFDTNGNGALDAADTTTVAGIQVNGLAAAGNFNLANPGDEVALFDGQTWYLDTDGNRNINAGDTVLQSNMRGYPVVGDFDGDGQDDLATYQNNVWYFDFNRDGQTDAQLTFGAPGRLDRPVVADIDGDGIDDLGLWVPDSGTLGGDGEWRWLVSNDHLGLLRSPGTLNALNHAFAPAPYGNDVNYKFGNPYAFPLAGNFGPAVQMIVAPPVVVTPPVLTSTASGVASSASSAATAQQAAPVKTTAQAPVTPVDVSVTKVAASKKVLAGANVVFTITVRNSNHGTAENVVLTDSLPAGLTIVSQRQTSGPAFTLSNTDTSISNTLASMPAGTVATFEVVVRADASLPNKLKLAGGARVTTSTPDRKAGNNAAAAKLTIQQSGVALAASTITPGTQDLIIGGSHKADVITVRPAGEGKVQVLIKGKNRGIFEPTGNLIIYGHAGNDVITVDPAVTLAALIFGGAGNDRLSAGGGNSVLVGGAGTNQLIGGTGHNVLIAGAGPAGTLDGTTGSSLFIAGTTSYDAHEVALARLLEEWAREDASYSTRVAHLRGTLAGGLNGSATLTSSTVSGNTSADTITAGVLEDLFFATLSGNAADLISLVEDDELTVPV